VIRIGGWAIFRTYSEEWHISIGTEAGVHDKAPPFGEGIA
jgi:hypothetical protein